MLDISNNLWEPLRSKFDLNFRLIFSLSKKYEFSRNLELLCKDFSSLNEECDFFSIPFIILRNCFQSLTVPYCFNELRLVPSNLVIFYN